MSPTSHGTGKFTTVSTSAVANPTCFALESDFQYCGIDFALDMYRNKIWKVYMMLEPRHVKPEYPFGKFREELEISFALHGMDTDMLVSASPYFPQTVSNNENRRAKNTPSLDTGNEAYLESEPSRDIS
jgi:hypothetical protein